MKSKKVEIFLKTLRESDYFIESIYIQGGCYQLHKILKVLFPEAKPYVKDFTTFPHVATLIEDSLYDISGFIGFIENYNTIFFLMTEEQQLIAEDWSFAGNNNLYYGECPLCEEPIKINRNKLIKQWKSQLNNK